MENLPGNSTDIQKQQPAFSKEQPQQVAQKNWGKIGFLVTVALFLAAAGVLGFYVLKTREGEELPQPAQIPTPTLAPIFTPTTDPTADWGTYKNEKYGFEFKYPKDYLIEESESEYGWIGKKIFFTVSDFNPEECRGDCPIIDFSRRVKFGNVESTELKGWIGTIGGNIPQSYISYILQKDNKYISFILYELERNAQVENPWLHKPGEVDQTDIKNLNLMLSTFKFLE